jgi:site-specific DNA recombinase
MRAVTYSRISLDREGQERGTSRQKADNRELVEEHGWTLVREFVDDDTGASTRSSKKRPDYDAMLDMVRAGEVDVIVAYSNSRLTRRPVEFEDLIRLHEQTGVRIVTKVSGDDDLSTADGRMVARIKASVDAAEAERTGERVARAHLESARQGRPIGHRAFGWDDDKVTLRLSEAEPMREVVKMMLDGLPTLRAANWLNDNGHLTAQSKLWSAATLKQYLINPRVAGFRTHRREVLNDEHGKPIKGLWEPLLDEATWEALRAKIVRADHRSVVSRPGTRTYMLTGLLMCGVCRRPMYGQKYGNGYGHYYMCRNPSTQKHLVSISGTSVERLIRSLVVAKIEADALEPAEAGEFAGAARMRELEELIEESMAQLGGKIKAARIYAKIAEFETELDELEAERKKWLAVTAVPAPTQLTLAELESQPIHEQRGLVERYLEKVYVKPPTVKHPGRRFDPSRVVPIPREYEQLPAAQ